MHCKVYTLPFDSWIRSYSSLPDGLDVDEDLFSHLWEMHPPEYGKVVMFGKEVATPRWHQTYGKQYTFSGNTLETQPLDDPYLKKLVRWVNKHARQNSLAVGDVPHNGVLINWYADGNHYIGAHADDERQLVRDSPIYSFTFGQERTFKVTSKKNMPEGEQIDPLEIQMADNTFLIMGGKMQRYYKHEVPKAKKSEGDMGPRINITIRAFAD